MVLVYDSGSYHHSQTVTRELQARGLEPSDEGADVIMQVSAGL